MKIRIASLVNDSIVDGPGLRYGIYVQGCHHGCIGCHNPQTLPFDGGTEMDTDDIWKEIEENPLLSGITLSGGDPLFQPLPLVEICKKAKEHQLSVWCYTGFRFEELIEMNDPDIMSLLAYVDVLVDGPFILEQRTLELAFRGSSNQRLIDVPASLESKKVKEILL